MFNFYYTIHKLETEMKLLSLPENPFFFFGKLRNEWEGRESIL